MSEKRIVRTPSAYDYPLLIKHLLDPPLVYSPRREIVYRNIERYDYLTLRERVCRLAIGLRSLGVNPGDTVGVMDWDSHRYLECFFAVPMMGAILHTVNVRLAPDEILYTINHAGDDVILVNADFLPLLANLRDRIGPVKKYVLMRDRQEAPATTMDVADEYEGLLTRSSSEYDFPDLDENTQATAFYTTGTTGLPKGVYFSHRQLVLHTLALLTALSGYESQGGFTAGDVYMPLTPMFHVHAWGVPYLATLLGAKQVYPGLYEPETIFRLIVEERVTITHCVPSILHMIVHSPRAREVDLSKWKVVIGGAALPRSLCEAAMDLGINVYGGYGLSETCPVLTIANLKQPMLEWEPGRQVGVRCRAGLPLPLVDLRVVDREGRPLPHDGRSTGEVVVRAPWLTQGYSKETERSEDLWQGNWLHTGDLGFIDPEGYLQVTDRIKDVIKSGGEWVSSVGLEDLLTQHPAVSEAAVIAVPDDIWGERPLALVVVKEAEKSNLSPEVLREFLHRFVERGALTKWAVPDRFAFVDALPKTGVGKVNKRALREQYRS